MSLKGVVKGVTNRTLNDLNLLAEEKYKKAMSRLTICDSCDIFNKQTRKCEKSKGGCGCNMDNKVFCMECECPKGKW